MLILVVLALVLLSVSFLLFVATPWFLFGRAAVADLPSRPEARAFVGILATVAIAILVAPLGLMALISNGETVQHLSSNFSGLSFGL